MNIRVLSERPRHPIIAYLAAIILLLVIAVAHIIGHLNNNQLAAAHNQLKLLSQNLNYGVYYPQQLPKNASVDASTINKTSNSIIFNISFDGSKRIYVTEQARPANTDFSQLPDAHPFNTVAGQAVISNRSDQTIAMILNDKTWILMTSPYVIDQNVMRSIVNSFRTL